MAALARESTRRARRAAQPTEAPSSASRVTLAVMATLALAILASGAQSYQRDERFRNGDTMLATVAVHRAPPPNPTSRKLSKVTVGADKERAGKGVPGPPPRDRGSLAVASAGRRKQFVHI